jgi:hypothetical protein
LTHGYELGEGRVVLTLAECGGTGFDEAADQEEGEEINWKAHCGRVGLEVWCCILPGGICQQYSYELSTWGVK